jgi:hypothetical protein
MKSELYNKKELKELDIKRKKLIFDYFEDTGIKIEKIRRGFMGYFIYHEFAPEYKRTKRTKIKEEMTDRGKCTTYSLDRIKYKVDFISNEDEEDFERSLFRARKEAENRRG